MSYTVYLGADVLSSPLNHKPEQAIIDPVLRMSLNGAGSFTCTVPPTHSLYEAAKPMTWVTIYDNDEWLWTGRIIEVKTDFWKLKSIECEGILAALNDTIQPLCEYTETDLTITSIAPRILLDKLIQEHNKQVDADKQFTVGVVTVELGDKTPYATTNFNSTLEAIKANLTDKFGGYLRVRKVNNTFYLDYLKDYADETIEVVHFGDNLLDFTRNTTAQDIATRVIPLGWKIYESEVDGMDERLTIATENNGNVYLESAQGVSSFGKVTKVVIWDEIQDAKELKEKGKEWLSANQWQNVVFDVKCSDLSDGIAYEDDTDELYLLETSDDRNLRTQQGDGIVVQSKSSTGGKAIVRVLKTDKNDAIVTSTGDRLLASLIQGKFKIGNSVRVLSEPHGLDAMFPLSELETRLDDPDATVITLGKDGKAIPLSAASAQITDTVEQTVRDKLPDTNKILEAAKANASALINASTHGHVVLEPERILIMNAREEGLATQVWQWNSGGLGYSDSLNPDGTRKYKLAMTMDGAIVADFITTGTLDANLITAGTIRDRYNNNWWDLDHGTFHLSSSSIPRSVTSVTTEYGLSTSSSVAPTTWSVGTPQWEQGKYIWVRTTYRYSDSDTPVYEVACIQGARGIGTRILGTKPTINDLPATGAVGDCWLVDGYGYTWDETNSEWVNVGRIQGEQGATGPQGPAGRSGTRILGTKSSTSSLPTSTASDGDCWLVNGYGWQWNASTREWVNIGRIQGIDGTNGTNGRDGIDGDDGEDGVSVVSIEPRYALHNSAIDENAPPESSFTLRTPPEWEEGMYIWTAYRIQYSNNVVVYAGKCCDVNLNSVYRQWKVFEANDNEFRSEYNALVRELDYSWLKSSDPDEGYIKTSSGLHIATTTAGRAAEDVTQRLQTLIDQTSDALKLEAANEYTKKTETAEWVRTLRTEYNAAIDIKADEILGSAVRRSELNGEQFEYTEGRVNIKADLITQGVIDYVSGNYATTAWTSTQIANAVRTKVDSDTFDSYTQQTGNRINQIVAKNANQDLLTGYYNLTTNTGDRIVLSQTASLPEDERGAIIALKGGIYEQLAALNADNATAIEQLEDRISLVAINDEGRYNSFVVSTEGMFVTIGEKLDDKLTIGDNTQISQGLKWTSSGLAIDTNSLNVKVANGGGLKWTDNGLVVNVSELTITTSDISGLPAALANKLTKANIFTDTGSPFYFDETGATPKLKFDSSGLQIVYTDLYDANGNKFDWSSKQDRINAFTVGPVTWNGSSMSFDSSKLALNFSQVKLTQNGFTEALSTAFTVDASGLHLKTSITKDMTIWENGVLKRYDPEDGQYKEVTYQVVDGSGSSWQTGISSGLSQALTRSYIANENAAYASNAIDAIDEEVAKKTTLEEAIIGVLTRASNTLFKYEIETESGVDKVKGGYYIKSEGIARCFNNNYISLVGSKLEVLPQGVQIAFNAISDYIQFTNSGSTAALQFKYGTGNRDIYSEINKNGMYFYSGYNQTRSRFVKTAEYTRDGISFFGSYINPYVLKQPPIFKIDTTNGAISFNRNRFYVEDDAQGNPVSYEIPLITIDETDGIVFTDGEVWAANGKKPYPMLSINSDNGVIINSPHSQVKIAQFNANGLLFFDNESYSELARICPYLFNYTSSGEARTKKILSLTHSQGFTIFPQNTNYRAYFSEYGEFAVGPINTTTNRITPRFMTSAYSSPVDTNAYNQTAYTAVRSGLSVLSGLLVDTISPYSTSLRISGSSEKTYFVDFYRDYKDGYGIHIAPATIFWSHVTVKGELYVTQESQFNGKVYFRGGTDPAISGSDARLKKNISPSTVKALEAVTGIDMKSFDWIKDGGHTNVGIIAQQLRQVAPDLVVEHGESSEQGINSFGLLNYCVKAIQELADFVGYKPKKHAEWKDPYTLDEKLEYNRLYHNLKT